MLKIVFILVRLVWEYHPALEEPREAVTTEIATCVRAVIRATWLGRLAERGFRIVLFALLLAVAFLIVCAVLFGLLLWWLAAGWLGAVVGLAFAAGGVWIGFYWYMWGLGLRWVDEHATDETVPLREVPGRIRVLLEEHGALLPAPLRAALEAAAAAIERRVGSAT
jgi:hypothetical protein